MRALAGQKSVKCTVGPCPRLFRPGITGSNGRCSRCLMRHRRGQEDVTTAEAQLAEARASGDLPARSARLVGYVRPALAELVGEQVASGLSESESALVGMAVAQYLGREDLA
jgi:hypothetical protein